MLTLALTAALAAPPGKLIERLADADGTDAARIRLDLAKEFTRRGQPQLAARQARLALPDASPADASAALSILVDDADRYDDWSTVDTHLDVGRGLSKEVEEIVAWRRGIRALDAGEAVVLPELRRNSPMVARYALLRGIADGDLDQFRVALDAASPEDKAEVLRSLAHAAFGVERFDMAAELYAQLGDEPLALAWTAYYRDDYAETRAHVDTLGDGTADWAEGQFLAALTLADSCETHDALERLARLEEPGDAWLVDAPEIGRLQARRTALAEEKPAKDGWFLDDWQAEVDALDGRIRLAESGQASAGKAARALWASQADLLRQQLTAVPEGRLPPQNHCESGAQVEHHVRP